jgi:hypothetical protein
MGREFHSGWREFCAAGCLSALAVATTGFASLLGIAFEMSRSASAAVTVPPQSSSAGSSDSDEKRVADLVTGNHILFDQGVVDGFGHISVRSAKNSTH